jgi:hypothetical protein
VLAVAQGFVAVARSARASGKVLVRAFRPRLPTTNLAAPAARWYGIILNIT